MRPIYVPATISKAALMEALREATINNEDFDHRPWSIWDAEVLESAARMIREGYTPIESTPPPPGPQPRRLGMLDHDPWAG